jgi:hypothetical protein
MTFLEVRFSERHSGVSGKWTPNPDFVQSAAHEGQAGSAKSLQAGYLAQLRSAGERIALKDQATSQVRNGNRVPTWNFSSQHSDPCTSGHLRVGLELRRRSRSGARIDADELFRQAASECKGSANSGNSCCRAAGAEAGRRDLQPAGASGS